MTTLYLKYRPQKISELDLSDVRDLLSKIVSSGKIPHAFLFEGPRGSGKTSAARIIAKVLNCTNLSKDGEPCNECEQCVSITKGTNIDVIEMDAASHRGIDDIRLVRDSVKLSPSSAKKKVYVIDEAHMLTTEASNALLKTLEEPPGHVVFILATTNPEKLIDTIKSRTVRINFNKATVAEIVKSLTNVVTKEKLAYKNEVLELIAQNVDGSFRDAKKILEEVSIKGLLDNLEKAQNYLFSKSDFNIDEFFERIYKKDFQGCIETLDVAEKSGVPAKVVYKQVVTKLKDLLFSVSDFIKDPSNKFEKQSVLALSDIFITFWGKYQNDVSDYMPFYLSVAAWCDSEIGGKDDKKAPIKKNEKNPVAVDENAKLNHDSGNGADANYQTDGLTPPLVNGENISEEVWKQVLQVIRAKNASTEALLRASKPLNFDGKTLSLGVFYKFHKEKLESVPHNICLEDCLQDVTGSTVKVECFLTQPESVNETKSTNGVHDATDGEAKQNGASTQVLLSETEDPDLAKLVDEVFG